MFTVDLVRRAEILAKTHYCTNLRQHESHIMVLKLAKWLGGGAASVRCPGHETDDREANLKTHIEANR